MAANGYVMVYWLELALLVATIIAMLPLAKQTRAAAA
jgi:hypothetical protein